MIYGLDVSQYNNYIPGSEEFVFIKISGGDAGLYFDAKATLNYNSAKNAGKVVGGYHFAGGIDPIAEADFFIRGMTPIEEYDIFILDWEIQHTNPVAWVQSFVNEVHSKTGVWCIVYLNISTVNAYDWSPVLSNCGLWLAAPSIPYDQNAPISHDYILQQGPIVNGIDQDVSFITLDELKAYGYHINNMTTTTTVAPQPVTSTEPVVAPVATVIEPTITTAPTTAVVPVIMPVVSTTPPTQTNVTDAPPVVTSTPPVKTKTSWWTSILKFLFDWIGL